MLFQPLDDKKFVGVYAGGSFHFDDLPAELSQTWKFCPSLDKLDQEVTYASLYCGGKNLSEACPSELLSEWERIRYHMKSHVSACHTAKVDFHRYSLFEAIPRKLFVEFLEIKNQITTHVLASYPKPDNYDFLIGLERLLEGIRNHKINLDLDALKPHLTSTHARLIYRRLKDSSRFVDYNAHKTKTGRLTTRRRSFPILTLNKQFRCAIKPSNDYFIELDYNAAELRTLLALAGKEQPAGDLHDWNAKHVYGGTVTREEAKKRIFAWLYNPASDDYLSSCAYDRDSVVKKYYNGSQVDTLLSRTIPADDHHALNYIIQSTTSDLFLRRAIEVDKLLEEKKSYIAFTLHDSLVIDYSKEDQDILKKLVDVFENTALGKYVVNVSVGEDFGAMRRLDR